MGKKKKNEKKTETDSATKPVCLACGKELLSWKEGDSMYCGVSCEIVHLKALNAEKDDKLAQFSRRKEAPKCYGLIAWPWSACTQEWYSKRSWDAKRRGNELRKLGFEVRIKGIGEMPVSNGNGKTELVGMSVLTCDHLLHNGEMVGPPKPQMVGEEKKEEQTTSK